MFSTALTRMLLRRTPVASAASRARGLSSMMAAAPSASLPSQVIVLEYKYGPMIMQQKEPLHEAHLFLAQEMIDQGKCIAGGPIVPHQGHAMDGSSPFQHDEPSGAFFWFTSLEAAQEFKEKDPYSYADIATETKIYDWNVAVSQK